MFRLVFVIENLLLEKPPVLNKHDILSALTGDSQNDGKAKK